MTAAIDAETEAPGAAEGVPVTVTHEGDRIYVPALRAEGVVVSTPDRDGRVRVKIGAATAVLPLRQLRARVGAASGGAPRDGAPRGGATRERADASAPPVTGPDLSASGTEVDVRGFEADDAVRAVERFLEDASVGGIQIVRIIHGKGKGILREEMKRFLANNQLVKEFRLGEVREGGTGVTIVTLDS